MLSMQIEAAPVSANLFQRQKPFAIAIAPCASTVLAQNYAANFCKSKNVMFFLALERAMLNHANFLA